MGYGCCFTSHQTDLADPSPQLIELDPSFYRGYEGKHTALHGMGRHTEAFEAFKTMLSKIDQSSDPQIGGKLFYHYRRRRVSFDGCWIELRHQ